jgi:hypothetical protein
LVAHPVLRATFPQGVDGHVPSLLAILPWVAAGTAFLHCNIAVGAAGLFGKSLGLPIYQPRIAGSEAARPLPIGRH